MSFFVVPIAGTGTRDDGFVPKYIAALPPRDGVPVFWRWRGLPRNWCVVYADTTHEEEATFTGNSDVIVVPPLDNTIAVSATKNALEALNIPSQWLTAGMTYRTVLRILCGMANFMQTCEGMGLVITLAGQLDKTLNQFSAQTRTILANAADALGLDRSSITGTTTVRETLRIMGQQFAAGRAVEDMGGL